MGLTDEATQKVRPPPNGRLGVLQRIAKVKSRHTKGKMALSLCSQDELQARERRVKMSKNKLSVKK